MTLAAKQPGAKGQQAQAWANKNLATAVAYAQEGRLTEAEKAVREVRTEMRGQPVAEDAQRGLDAIELAKDLEYLPLDSPVRRAMRKKAREDMRGTRWARLFRK